MAELFSKDKRTISEHIQNIFKEGELSADSIVRNFRIVQKEGAREIARQVDHYNLDAIISVGYRVKSHRGGTQFRIWATARLKEFLIKGFTLDDERLKRLVCLKKSRQQNCLLKPMNCQGRWQAIIHFHA